MRQLRLSSTVYLTWGTLIKNGVESVVLQASASGFKELIAVLRSYSGQPWATVRVDITKDPTESKSYPYLQVHLQGKIDWRLAVNTDERGVEFVDLTVNNAKLNKLIKVLEYQLEDSYCPSTFSVDDKRGSKN